MLKDSTKKAAPTAIVEVWLMEQIHCKTAWLRSGQ